MGTKSRKKNILNKHGLTRLNFAKRNLGGFTLIEIIVGMAILSVFTFSIGTFGSRILQSRLNASDTLATQDEISRAVAPMLTELRSMQFASTGSYPIEAVSTSSIIFYSDINKDGPVERIRYFIQGNVLKKGVTVPSGNPLSYTASTEKFLNILSGIVSDPNGIFAYYVDGADISGNYMAMPVNDVSLVRVIKINLILDLTPNGPPGPLRFGTAIAPRNLRAN